MKITGLESINKDSLVTVANIFSCQKNGVEKALADAVKKSHGGLKRFRINSFEIYGTQFDRKEFVVHGKLDVTFKAGKFENNGHNYKVLLSKDSAVALFDDEFYR
jgi:hypothetical protein